MEGGEAQVAGSGLDFGWRGFPFFVLVEGNSDGEWADKMWGVFYYYSISIYRDSPLLIPSCRQIATQSVLNHGFNLFVKNTKLVLIIHSD